MKRFLDKKNVYFLLIPLLLFSCEKEKITNKHIEFIGIWLEQSDENIYHKLDISNYSKGTYYECTKGVSGDCADTQFRKWRIKNNHLYYGLANDLGEITQYPTIATIDILFGPNYNDTIKVGTKYMILNYGYWIQ